MSGMEINIAVLGLVSAWLAILSWFDIKTREVPHIAWVGIPYLVAVAFRLISGSYALAILALLVGVASERERIPLLKKVGLLYWIGDGVLICLISVNTPVFMGCLAVLGFWLAWEFKAWGGADAIASIALSLLWPDSMFVLALVAVHVVIVLAMLLIRRSWKMERIPGMPALLATALLRGLLGIFGVIG